MAETVKASSNARKSSIDAVHTASVNQEKLNDAYLLETITNCSTSQDKLPTHPEDIELTLEEKQIEKKLRWKLDLVILPILSLIYFLSTVGRSDLANAQTIGLGKDLSITPQQYSNLASFFQIGYIVFQIPGTILIRQLGAQWQFGTAMLFWGIFTVCNVAAKNYGTLLGLRILVGVAEAFIQGAVFYLSFWYTYQELALRGAVFFSTSALAGAFNGLIASGLARNENGVDGLAAWQWLYLIEGVIPIACAFIVYAMLPSSPEKRHYLFTRAERQLAIKRSRAAHNPVDAKVRWKLLYTPLVEVRFWLIVIIGSADHFGVGTLQYFIPSILLGLGYNVINAQLMAVVVYACAAVGIVFFAYFADKYQQRGTAVLISSVIALVGYIILLITTNNKARMAAVCLAAFGLFPGIPLITVWAATQLAGYTKRGFSLALLNMIQTAVSIAGNQVYIDPPYYHKGIEASIGMTAAMIVTTAILLLVIRWENDRRDKLRAALSPEQYRVKQAESLDVVGDRHIDVKYGY